jgi:hypothetical protein
MTAPGETPLSSVPGWTPDLVRKLAPNGITSAEQVVGACATSEGQHHLAGHLGVSGPALARLVAAARAALPPAVARELAQPADTSQYGLGAAHPADDD